MWKPMQVPSLSPLARLESLSHLFMTNLRVDDGSLQALKSLTHLRVLQCAKFFSAEEFSGLAAALPALRCDWFPAAPARPT